MPESASPFAKSGRARAPDPRFPDLFATSAQRRLEKIWERWSGGSRDLAELVAEGGAVRPGIAASWLRCREAAVSGALARAPRLLGPGELHEARSSCDWLPLVPDVVRERQDIFLGGAYVLSVFDRRGRMLFADGDPDALGGLAEINFSPGGMWAEEVAGTNGPGTALATGRAVQVVGAEHWCEGWKPWHCAAAPVRDPATGRVVGVLDLSARVEESLPHALTVVRALAVAVEERLASRAAEDRSRTLTRWADLVASYPGDGVLALGRDGEVVARSGAWVGVLEAAGEERVGPGLVEALSHLAGRAGVGDFEHDLLPGGRAAVHPLHDGDRTLGACLVLGRASASTVAAAAVSGPETSATLQPATERSRASRASGSPASGASRGSRGSKAAGRSPGDLDAGAQVRYTLDDLLGESVRMKEVRRVARSCARTDLPVLLVGASGTGKEVVAQGIHGAGPRRARPFVAVNCGALPRELVVAELFGYREGAFSGARVGGATGTFDAADGGTLFLDEVGELPLDAQATLLRALEEGVVRPVGATSAHPVDVRVIAATNRDLMEAIAQGTFRADLYHRLAVLTVAMPTLAERREDIAGLAQRFLDRENRARPVPRHFTHAALRRLVAYPWPGNVRELLNLVRRLVALSETAEIGEEDLPPVIRDPAGAGACPPTAAGPSESPAAPAPGGTPATAHHTAAPAQHPEREALARVIESQPTMVAAARALGISRSTLYRRMERLGLEPGRAARLGRR